MMGAARPLETTSGAHCPLIQHPVTWAMYLAKRLEGNESTRQDGTNENSFVSFEVGKHLQACMLSSGIQHAGMYDKFPIAPRLLADQEAETQRRRKRVLRSASMSPTAAQGRAGAATTGNGGGARRRRTMAAEPKEQIGSEEEASSSSSSEEEEEAVVLQGKRKRSAVDYTCARP